MIEKISVIIKYKDVVTTSALDSVTMLDANVKHIHHSINAISADVPKDKIGKIKTDPNVEYVEIDQEAHILGFSDDYLHRKRKDISAAQTIPWGVEKIRATQVWPGGDKGTGIKVCVIDTGIDYNHEDLKDNYKGGYNFINNTNDPMDDNGHGTHVAGTVAAMDNDIGVIGVAPEASLYSLKVLDENGSGSYSNIIAAIQWAINNKMQIISMSLGGSGFSQAIKDICDAANNAGIVVIAAAGNSDGNGSKDTVSYPAKFDSVIAIAATDSNDARASFSSCGPEVELSAPGVNILSTVPNSGAKYSDSSGYSQLSGTSMSTPHVSGTVALLLKAHPEMTNADVRQTLQQTSVDLGQQGRDIFFGYGRIDTKTAVDHAPPPIKKYMCTGAPNYQCVEDPNGPYNSLEECQTACKAQAKKYMCTGAPNYQCVEDPNGPYNSLAECQTACKPAPQRKIFKAHIIGPTTKPTGILVMKSSAGNYTSDGACKLVCDTLKSME